MKYVLAINLKGSLRQIFLLQVIVIDVWGTVFCLFLFWIEVAFGVPLVKALLITLADDSVNQLPFLYVILASQLVPFLFFLPWTERVLSRLAPPTRAEIDGQPQFIIHVPVHDISNAIDAVENEQKRLTTYLGNFFKVAEGEDIGHTEKTLAGSFANLSKEIDYYLEDLGQQTLPPDDYERLKLVASRQSVLESLADLTYESVCFLRAKEGSVGVARFFGLVHTALDTAVDTARSAHVDQNNRDLERLRAMVGDRSETLDKIRLSHVNKHQIEDADERMSIVRLTVVAERLFWGLDMLRKTLLSAPTEKASIKAENA